MRIAALLFCCGLAGAQTPGTSAEIGPANLPAQRIGANDLISVSVYGAPELTRSVRVGADGLIRLPMLQRRLRAEGQWPGQLESDIAQALKAEQILVNPVVTVTVLEYYSRPISVAGAVNHPVTFQAVGAVTLLEAITRAGGLSQTAGPEILVSKTQTGEDGAPVTLTQRVPVAGLIDAADPELNVRLSGGEEIRVPEVRKIFVVGNVKKPGAFPAGDTGESTILRMLAMAEGLAPYASKQAFIIRRDDRTGLKHEIPVELKKILERKSPDVPLAANDILYIPDSSGRRASVAALDRIIGFGAATASGVLVWRR